jgi:hypothetical protein
MPKHVNRELNVKQNIRIRPNSTRTIGVRNTNIILFRIQRRRSPSHSAVAAVSLPPAEMQALPLSGRNFMPQSSLLPARGTRRLASRRYGGVTVQAATWANHLQEQHERLLHVCSGLLIVV